MSCCKKQKLGYGCGCKPWYNREMRNLDVTIVLISVAAYVALVAYLIQSISPRIRSDVNKDGKVDIADVSIVIGNFTQ